MADLRTSLEPRFEAALRAAFGEQYANTDPSSIARSARIFQADVAMSLARKVGKPPKEVAIAIANHLEVKDICEVEVTGPGFININLSADYLAREVGLIARDKEAGLTPSTRPETVVIDYSAPNVARRCTSGTSGAR